MKRSFLLSVTVVLAAFLFGYTACKKVSHPTNPTPDNYRLLSYTKVTTKSILIPFTITPIVSENYRFVYDGDRVSTIFFTSNDSNKVKKGMANLKIAFTYIADSIYRISTDLNTLTIKQRDTFLRNTSGQIIHAYFPDEVHHFTYFGKLLSNETVVYRDTGTALTAHFTYTSDEKDHLNRLWDGVITVNFPDSGIVPYNPPPPYIFHDTSLTYPLDVVWNTVSPGLVPTNIPHLGHNGTSDHIDGYFMHSVTVDAVDAQGVKVRKGYFPAGHPAKLFYQYYDELDNRPGDYLQIESFTTYGVNIYPNKHLSWSLSSPYNTTRVTYDIDADSKVTHVYASTKDSLLKNIVDAQYKLQYETH